MAFKIYSSGNMVVITNTAFQESKKSTIRWRTEKIPRDRIWYEFDPTAAPIKYSLYYDRPERDMILEAEYTAFQREDASTFATDVELQKYLDSILGSDIVNTLTNSGQIDAGGRIRVSQLTTLLDISQINDNQPLFFNRVNIGQAEQQYSKPVGGAVMTVYADGDAAICQSKMFAPYFAGKGQFGEVTFDHMDNEANVVKRAGYFSSSTTSPHDTNKDGLWFEADGTNYRLRIQKDGGDILNVAQSDWNIDTFGEFDLIKFNVFIFQFLYLGGTTVRFGFIYKGFPRWVHLYVHAGQVEETFVYSPNQPIRYEIRSTGGAGDMGQICAMIASEGSIDEVGVNRHFSNGAIAFGASSADTEFACIGIRLKDAYRNIRIEIKDINIFENSNAAHKWRVLLNPTVADTFAYSDQTNSALQLATGAAANTVTNPELVIAEGFGVGGVVDSPAIESAIRIGSTIAGVADELVVTVIPFTNNQTARVTLGVQEFL